MATHTVLFAASALKSLMEIPSKDDSARVRRRLEALSTMPYMGAVYDPTFESARPPYELRATYAGHYGIYYVFDEGADTVYVAFIEDSRRDPKHRFQT